MRSGGNTELRGSFSVFCNKIMSGADTGSGGKSLTIFLNRHHAAFYKLYNNQSDEHGNPITDSLPSGGAESHYQISTGKSTSSSSQNRPSLQIVCPPCESTGLTWIRHVCVCVCVCVCVLDLEFTDSRGTNHAHGLVVNRKSVLELLGISVFTGSGSQGQRDVTADHSIFNNKRCA